MGSSGWAHRRRFLQEAGVSVAALAGLTACGPAQQLCQDPGDACGLTPSNPEGPYYRAGAPERTEFNVGGRPGDALQITGRVLSADCRTPIPDALLDIWHADGDGIYDLDTEEYGLRGKVRTDGDGRYVVNTVMPGPYWFGSQPRARHVHVRLEAEGHQPLTTQLYFAGDSWISRDLQFQCGLAMEVDTKGEVMVARFDFTLPKA